MNEEIWKNIDDYEGLYQISSIGKLKRTEGYDSRGHYRKEKILKPKIDKDGYYEYALSKNGKVRYFRAHRLVAEAFIPNPENKPCIDHINCIRSDNRIENLKWCTNKENHNNPLSIVNHSRANYIPIIQYSLNGEILKIWDSAITAENNTNTHHQAIAKCCKNRYGCKSAGGCKWRYLEDQLADWLEEIQDEDMAAQRKTPCKHCSQGEKSSIYVYE